VEKLFELQVRPALRGTSRTGPNASGPSMSFSPLWQLDRGRVDWSLGSGRAAHVMPGRSVDTRCAAVRAGGGRVAGKVFDGCRGARARCPAWMAGPTTARV